MPATNMWMRGLALGETWQQRTKLDLSDCGTVIDAGQDFDSAAIGADGIYIGTFSTSSEVYRVPRP